MRWFSLALATGLILWPPLAMAQGISVDFGQDGSLTARSIQLFLVISILSVAPGIVIMVTCFPFIVTVLSILRQAIGLQQSPPNMLIVSLALFLTYFVMDPVFTKAWANGVSPLLDGQIDFEAAFPRTIEPFRLFMASRLDGETFDRILALRPPEQPFATTAEAPLSVLVSSFLLSEIAHAFQVGFLIFLPFVIIDLVVAAILMSIGMMMVPPAVVSLPFKLAFFVIADGWALVTNALVTGYF
jgi:flagellar biosynthesis protein FliP